MTNIFIRFGDIMIVLTDELFRFYLFLPFQLASKGERSNVTPATHKSVHHCASFSLYSHNNPKRQMRTNLSLISIKHFHRNCRSWKM